MRRNLLLFGLLACGFLRSQSTPPKIEARLGSRLRTEQLAATPTDERIFAIENALKAAPANMRIKMDLVSAYLQKVRESGDFTYLDRASTIVDRILEQDNSLTIASHFQNEIDLQRHKFLEVANRAGSMTKYDPSDAASWANLGDASMELGQYNEAGTAFTRMYALHPDLASYNRLAYFRFVTGDSETALELMKQAVASGSPTPENTAWCEAELGDMYFKLGKVGEARNAYTSALDLFPKLHRAIAGMARIEALEGKSSQAIVDYQRAQAIIPLVEYAGALEELYAKSGRTDKAREQRELIETIDQLARATDEKTNRNLAVIYADRNWHLDRAMQLIAAELPTRGDVYTWDAASWVYFRNGDLTKAADASAKAMRFNTPEPAFYRHAAAIADAAGKAKVADEYRSRLATLAR